MVINWRKFQTTKFWNLVQLNKSVLEFLFDDFENDRSATRPLPRYVQKRLLKSGMIGYYWCPPHWARKNGFPLISEALGSHLDKAEDRIENLNDYLDKWRESHKT